MIGGALSLGGCSGMPELPYPKLAQIVKVNADTLSLEEQQKLIQQLKHEQETHETEAARKIESK